MNLQITLERREDGQSLLPCERRLYGGPFLSLSNCTYSRSSVRPLILPAGGDYPS